eukprot:15180234-Alexandrium_andersonii.AAC.1
MSASLVGSEMCIRDSLKPLCTLVAVYTWHRSKEDAAFKKAMERMELLYASGASRVVVLPEIHSLDAVDSSAYTKNARPYDSRGWCCVGLLIASFFGRVANPRDSIARNGATPFLSLQRGLPHRSPC